MARTLGENLRRNTVSSVVAWLFQQGTKFILVPIIIRFLDYDGYGLVTISFAMMGYFTLSIFGMHSASVKYTADCETSGDYERLSGLLSTGMAVGWILGLTVIVAVWCFAGWIVGFLNISPERQAEARFVVTCIGIIGGCTNIFGLYDAVLTGIQRIDVIKNVRIAFSSFEFIVILILLYMGYGVRAVVGVYTISLIGIMLAEMVLAIHYLPQVRINVFRANRAALGPVLSLGGRMQLLAIVAMVMNSLDGLGITKYQGLAFAGAYMVGRQLLQRLRGLPVQAFIALAPASAHLHSREDSGKLLSVYTMAMRLTSITSAFMFAFLAVNSDLVIRGYIGPDQYDQRSVYAMSFLCVATLIHILTGPGSSMLRGAGKPLLETIYQSLAIVLFLALFGYAQRQNSEVMIIMSWPVAMTLSSLVFLVMCNVYFGAPVLCPLSSSILIFAVAPFLAWMLRLGWAALPLDLEPSRWSILLGLGCTGAVYTVLFAVAVWFLPGLRAEDKVQLIRFLPGNRRILSLLKRPQSGPTP